MYTTLARHPCARFARRSAAAVALAASAAGCTTVPPAVDLAAPAPPTTAQAGSTTVVAVAPPAEQCCPHPTIWDTLGVTQGLKALGAAGTCILSALGTYYPGLEPRPAILPITDPKNLESPNPAVKSAAGAKSEEDAAPQKIKAIRYLATLGCGGCYPDIEAALLAALDDCTESVRYEAVMALRSTAGNPCQVCKAEACCSPKVIERLEKVANETDTTGCYVESSARVRRVARLAIAACGTSPPPPGPTEGPTEEPIGEEGPTQAAVRVEALEAIASTARVYALPTHVAHVAPAGALPKPLDPQRYAPPTADAISATTDMQVAGVLTSHVAAAAAEPVVAEVNGEPIFDAQVRARVDAYVAQTSADDPSVATHEALRELYHRQLAAAIDARLLAQEARRRLPPTDILLAADETTLAREWLRRHATPETAVSYDELAAHYQAHLADFCEPAETRWELWTARFDRFGGKDRAYAAARDVCGALASAAALNTHVQVDPDVSVATYGWTRDAAAVDNELTRFLAEAPVGAVGPVVEGAEGFQVVRVVDRRAERTVPFDEARDAVYRSVVDRRRAKAERRCLDALRSQAAVVVRGPTVQVLLPSAANCCD